ncbi:BMP family ABC transporter substrate-binding protein [Gluconacetobacter entanii]|nr:BMP family ABC transporter substrate-binding protein [Gluconacetobacter entanii]
MTERHTYRPVLAALALTLATAVPHHDAGAHAAGANDAPAVLVVGQGGLGDQSYNDLGVAGFQRGLRLNNLPGHVVETASVVAEGADILQQAATSGAGLVVDLEYSHGPVMQDVAPLFPRCHFVILNQVVSGANITSVMFEEHEGSYLAGVLAAQVMRDGHAPGLRAHRALGVIGGTRSVGIDKFIAGFIQGARSVTPGITVRVAYADSFNDPAKGLQMADVMYNGGVGIIYAVAGVTSVGVIHAAQDSGLYAIGVDQDEDALAPGHVLTSMLKHTDVAIERIVQTYHDGEIANLPVLHMGLSEGGVGLSPMSYTRALVPAAALAAVDAARRDIIAGRVKVWNVATEGYPEFMR